VLIIKKSGKAMMFPHYEDVLRQDLLLKLNHANVMEVPGLFEIRLVPKAASDFRIPFSKWKFLIVRDSYRHKGAPIFKQESRFDPIHSWGPKKTLDMSVTLHDKAFSEGMECTIFWSES